MNRGQCSVFRSPSPACPPAPPRRPLRCRAAAFTLTELLIVIGIITVVAFIAVPSFQALTGGRSTEAAHNQLSGLFGRARSEAIGLQKIHGVAFFLDPDSQRVQAVMVRQTEKPSVPPALVPDVYLDFIPDRDPVMMPNGVSLQMIDDTRFAAPAGRQNDAYIGFNVDTLNGATVTYGGVVLFDGYGRVVSKSYAFKTYLETAPGVRVLSQFGRTFNMTDPPAGTARDLVPPVSAEPAPFNVLPRSHFGFVVYDQAAFKEQTNFTEADPQYNSGTYGADERAEEAWLDANSIPELVNRNNGTLVKGE